MLSTVPMHHVHLLLVKKEEMTMRHNMVLAVAGARCQSSAECKAQSEVVLSTTSNIALLKNGVLQLVSTAQTKVFHQKRMSNKLSRCSAAHASWSGRR